jgi:hypothetical protein
MDIKIFSAKDYFNYYFSGVVWLSCAFVFTVAEKNLISLSSAVEVINNIPTTILVALLLIIPFIIGFVLNPVGNLVTTLLRKIVGDPADWVLVLSGQSYSSTKRLFRKRISGPSRKNILEKLALIQDGDAKCSPFYLVRNYVAMKANQNAQTLVNRPLDLANLAESLLIPMSLLTMLTVKTFFIPIVSVLLGLFVFVMLCCRYFKLREYWVKNNYRTFLFLE